MFSKQMNIDRLDGCKWLLLIETISLYIGGGIFNYSSTLKKLFSSYLK